MTASEFAFLGLGLVLGIASGVAIVEVFRSRPSARREVRVTVTPDSVPRRSSTLATSPFLEPHAPAAGGPGERRGPEGEPLSRPAEGVPARVLAARPSGSAPVSAAATFGQRAVGIAIRPEGRAGEVMREALRAAEARATAVLGGHTVARAAEETTATPATGTAATGTPATGTPGAAAQATGTPAAPAATRTVGSPAATAVADRPDGGTRDVSATTPAAEPNAGTDAGPCAEVRRVSDERCALASAARDRAAAAATTFRETQHAYDDHQERAERATEAADPLRLRTAKDAAQRAFRTERDRAQSRAELEAAARNWLVEINRINAESRGAAEAAARERAAATALVTVLERLSLDADAARIAAETADEACLAARQALADCEESSTQPSPAEPHAPSLEPAGPPDLARPISAPRWETTDADDGLAAAVAGGEPLVLALLRGDRTALERVAAGIAGDDETARRTWALEIGRLVEAVVDRAIEASALDFPPDHPFWGPFTRAQCREITAALASLGFRFDGLGGWADERVPSQRDLSLAVGYAGLDPMRIRRWPDEAEMADLYRNVRVAADEYLAEAAAGLTLGELVSLLGPRADALADVWNSWGRIRPVLLEPA